MAGAALTASPVDSALAYAGAGYPVFPVYPVEAPAPPEIVVEFKAGRLTKKEAQAHARCACGQHPCRSPGKHPIIANGVDGATTDAEQIAKWWAEAPEANVGVRLPPGKFAVDFDTYAPGVPERLAALRASAPATLEQESGAGGVHLVFEAPADHTFGSYLDGQSGVDLIHNAHRYLVAEPSNHWTGGSYRWVNDATPAAAPPALLARCARGARGPSTPANKLAGPGRWSHIKTTPSALQCPPGKRPEDWAVHIAKTFPPAISDGEPGGTEPGHVTLKRVAGHLIAGLGIDSEEAMWILWEHYNPRCVPPWEEGATGNDGPEDFERTVKSAGAGLTPGYLLARMGEAPPTEDDAPADPYALLGDLVDLGVEPDPLDYIIEGLPFASGGKVNAIQAQPRGAKTPTALLLGVCVGTGLDFLGHKVLRPGPVLYLDAETGRLARIRYRRICRALGVDPKAVPFEFRDVKGMFSPEYLATLEKRLRDRPARLVLVDTYGAMLDASIDTNSPQFAHWARQLGVLSRTLEVVIVILIHEKKGGGKRGAGLEMIAGNYQGAGAFQAAIALVPTGERNTDPVEVVCSRAPEDDFPPFHIRWEDVPSSPGKDLKAGGTGLRAVRVDAPDQPAAVDTKAAESKRVKVARAVLENLERTPYQNKTKVVKGTRGADEKVVRRIFDELVEAGVLLEAKTGERVNGKGEVEAVLVYSVAPLDKRVVEARMKLGIVE